MACSRYIIFLTSLLLWYAPSGFIISQQQDHPALFDRKIQSILQRNNDIAAPYALDLQSSSIDSDKYNVLIYGDRKALNSLDIPVFSRHEDFVTSLLSSEEIEYIAYQQGIHRIKIGGKFSYLMDKSSVELRTNHLRDGLIGHRAYTGEGIIVGIIDTGVDMYHHDFRYGDNLNKTRILSIWDMSIVPVASDRHPQLFSYGVEYTREDIEHDFQESNPVLRRVRSTDRVGHGTSLAGVIGGDGTRSDGEFRGNAPSVQFIFVTLPFGNIVEPQLIDAVNYIFTEAEKHGKPAVINLSLGTHFGAHDGTSALELVIDEYNRMSGRAIVVAAGNSGKGGIHTKGEIPQNSSAQFSVTIEDIDTTNNSGDSYNISWMQIWYESGDTVSLTITSPHGESITMKSGDSVLTETPDGTIDVITYNNYTNPRGARIFDIVIYQNQTDNRFTYGNWNFSLDSNESALRYNMWLIDSFGVSVHIHPNTGKNYTITVPATAETAISVGSYTLRNTWETYIGTRTIESELFALSGFSSWGPTRDERIKPEITAPGEVIISTLSNNARNRFFTRYIHNWYEVIVGTSASAAQITGIVALLLEHNPELSGVEIREILMQSAKSDYFTGITPNYGWGYGKADAFAAVGYAGKYVDYPLTIELSENYPNPFNSSTIIQFTLAEESHVVLRVYDILGREIRTLVDEQLSPTVYSARFDATGLSSGVYFYRIEAGAFSEVKKMLLLR